MAMILFVTSLLLTLKGTPFPLDNTMGRRVVVEQATAPLAAAILSPLAITEVFVIQLVVDCLGVVVGLLYVVCVINPQISLRLWDRLVILRSEWEQQGREKYIQSLDHLSADERARLLDWNDDLQVYICLQDPPDQTLLLSTSEEFLVEKTMLMHKLRQRSSAPTKPLMNPFRFLFRESNVLFVLTITTFSMIGFGRILYYLTDSFHGTFPITALIYIPVACVFAFRHLVMTTIHANRDLPFMTHPWVVKRIEQIGKPGPALCIMLPLLLVTISLLVVGIGASVYGAAALIDQWT